MCAVLSEFGKMDARWCSGWGLELVKIALLFWVRRLAVFFQVFGKHYVVDLNEQHSSLVCCGSLAFFRSDMFVLGLNRSHWRMEHKTLSCRTDVM